MSRDYNVSQDSLTQVKDDLPQTWDFDKEKVMKGFFTGKQEKVGKNESTVYQFDTENFGEIAVWDTAQLSRLLNKAEIDQYFEIEFIQFNKIKNSDNEWREFSVNYK